MTTTIKDLIKTVQEKGKLLTHQQDQTTGVSQYACSCFVERENVLVKGECRNPKKKERKALLIFLDLETGKLRGEQFLVFFSLFLGRARTSNPQDVWSVDHFRLENETYVLASGDGHMLDVFKLSDVKEGKFTGNRGYQIYVYRFTKFDSLL